MTRTASIASLTLAAAVWTAPTAGHAGADDPVRFLNMLPERQILAPEPAAKRHVRPTDSRKEKPAKGEAEKALPSGPLHIVVSIARQRVTLYADGHQVASSAASTGMPGHPTPVGVFSVIQKDRHHYSNIYGAAMPYMQRITWSGSALHEGPLPGHPASHGCIRLSSGFAQLLWKATKIGARVIVTRDDVAPAEIDMPNPFIPKAKMVDAPALTTLIKVADSTGTVPITSGAGDSMAQAAPIVQQDKPGAMITRPADNRSAPEQSTKIGGGASTGDAAVKVDVPAASAPVTTRAVATEAPAESPAKTQEKIESKNDAKTPSASEQATKSNGDTAQTVTSAKTTERPPIDTAKPADPIPMIEPAPVNFDGIAKTAEQPAAPKPAPQPASSKPVVAEPAMEKPAAEKPAAIKPVLEQRPVSSEPVPLPLPAPSQRARRAGDPVSIFISRKEAKLYVRQKMQPLFDSPVSFERPDQPVGTHVFTAMAAKGDNGGMRWTVISIPSNFRHPGERKHSEPGRKRHNDESARPTLEQIAPVPDARTAFERVIIPPETVERLAALFIPGSSIIVSDNKLSDETGEYTEFIVLTP